MKNVFILINLFAASSAFAQIQLLENITPVGGTPPGDLSTYLQTVFTFGISLAGILAVISIVVGGVQYIVAYGNPGQIGKAKERITQALLGLLLAVTAWLILNTINPDLTRGSLNLGERLSLPPLNREATGAREI